MSGAWSNAAAWSMRLVPPPPVDLTTQRADDPRLATILETWTGDPAQLRPGRAALVGFPQDEGVRRNGGRPGACEAPGAIRQALRRLTPWDGSRGVDLTEDPPLDLGDLRIEGTLEETQTHLGVVVAALLEAGMVPIVLGGGHETALGTYLGHAAHGDPVAVVNLDAHLDVRPLIAGLGHSGSPFRQMRTHPKCPLPGDAYACLGAQPHSVAREHVRYVEEAGGVIGWGTSLRAWRDLLHQTLATQTARGRRIHLSLDADVVRAADVPGVSAPNAAGLPGKAVLQALRVIARTIPLASFDLVEINPRYDSDGRSLRWAALVLWNVLMGLAESHMGPK